MTNPLNNLSIYEMSLEYARRGFQVIPLHSIDADGNCTCGDKCTSPAKHPIASLVPNGLKNASSDPNILANWFEGKNRNIGIVTGKDSGLVVLDVDYKNGGSKSFDDLLLTFSLERVKEIVATISVQSGNGEHYYYQYTPLKNSTSKLGQGLDIRGDGGYVVAAPSIHANGKTYEISALDDLAEFPKEWLPALNAPKQTVNQSNGSNGNGLHIPAPTGYQVPDLIVDGTRHNSLVSMAGKLHFDGFSPEAIEAVLLIENKKRMQTPATDADVKKIAQRVTKTYQPGVVYTQPIADDQIAHWDDIAIANLFVKDNLNKLRFNPEAKKWFVWQGTHWQLDKTDEVIKTATNFSQSLYTRVNNLVSNTSQMKDAMKQIFRSNCNTGLKAFLDLSKSYLSVSQNQFDTNPYLLNCKNGTVDLKTGELLPHNSNNFFTKLVPYNYDKYAQTHAFDGFLKSVQLNPEIRKFIQRSIGYSLLGIARERSFWILYGNGNNGKSIFIDLFSELLNDYASSTTSASVMNQKTDRIPNDIARLNGKRFVVIPETEENERFNASLIKALSAGDKITARFLFGEFFDFYFSGKLWIATNHKPQITDHSKGFWDRLKIIPFTVDIPKASVIKRDILLGSLLNEAPAILNWAVQGCLEYLNKSDLDVPKSIQDEIDLYKYEQDLIAQFITECLDFDDQFTTDHQKLYEAYRDFCNQIGSYPFKKPTFTIRMKQKGFEQKNGSGYSYWKNIALK